MTNLNKAIIVIITLIVLAIIGGLILKTGINIIDYHNHRQGYNEILEGF